MTAPRQPTELNRQLAIGLVPQLLSRQAALAAFAQPRPIPVPQPVACIFGVPSEQTHVEQGMVAPRQQSEGCPVEKFPMTNPPTQR